MPDCNLANIVQYDTVQYGNLFTSTIAIWEVSATDSVAVRIMNSTWSVNNRILRQGSLCGILWQNESLKV